MSVWVFERFPGLTSAVMTNNHIRGEENNEKRGKREMWFNRKEAVQVRLQGESKRKRIKGRKKRNEYGKEMFKVRQA